MRLRDYQQGALDGARELYRKGQRAALVELPTGCHRKGQRVLLATGEPIAVEHVRHGDYLMGPDGTPREVLELVGGRGEMVEILPTKGAPWVVDLDHVLTLVRTPAGHRYPSDRGGALVDVTVREWLSWSRSRKHLHKLVRSGCIEFPPLEWPRLDPYVLGVLIGDGSLKRGITVTCKDREIWDACRAEAERWGLRFVEQTPAGRCEGFRIAGHSKGPGTNPMLDHLREAGGYEFGSSSRALAEDVAFIARSLGLAAYLSPTRSGHFRVSITGACETIPCLVKRKRSGARRQKKSVLRTGFAVRKLAVEEQFYGFRLDGDQRYLLDDFTITHNCGKTVVFSEAIRLACEKGGKALVIAHRTELLEQAIAKLRRVAPDLRIELEQASSRATTNAHVVVASVQTLRGDRLARWPVDAFQLVVVDEAHHATASTYRAILKHFAPARVLGVTATPDRADGAKLGEIFPRFAYQLGMKDAIAQGYLVPLRLRTVQVEALDLSHVRSRAGDFVEGELVAALEDDEVLLEIAGPLPELAGDRQTIVFVAGVKNAYRLAELLNERTGKPGCAVALDGTSDPEARRITLGRFERGAFQFLVNVGLFTEGFDCPAVSCVAVARPTQSRSLYCQMIGRGTRALPGVVDACSTGPERVAAIAASAKPDLLVLDFTPSARSHRLMTPLDVLGVESDDVRQIAELLLAEDPDLDVREALERAAEDEKVIVRKRLAKRYELTVEEWDPFRLVQDDLDFSGAMDLDLSGREPSGIREQLEKAGVPKTVIKKLSAGQCVAAMRAIEKRKRAGLCSLRQATQLQRFGLNPQVSQQDAALAMAMLQRVGWSHVPSQLANDPRFRLPSKPEARIA